MALSVTDAILAPTPDPEPPDFIDTVLASRAVVAAIRIAIIFAALSVVLSVIALISRRQWLTRVGPVEVSDLRVANKRLEEQVAVADRVVKELESTVAYTQQVIDKEQGR